MVHRAEAVITLDRKQSNNGRILQTVRDTIQITNRGNDKPPTPTINETVFLDKPCIEHSNKTRKAVDKNKLLKSIEDQKSDTNNKVTEARLFIEKKKKERTDKHIIDSLEKKKLAEERKKRLDQLQKTTRELAKASIKRKVIHVQDKCKIDTKIPIVSNNSKVDQTWSPPPIKKTLTKPINLQKGFKTMFDEDDCLNVTNNVNDKLTPYTYSKIPKHTNTILNTSIIDKKHQIHEVTKPENLFSKLNFSDGYELIDKNIFNISTSKIVDVDILDDPQKYDNCVKQIDICDNNEVKQESDSICLEKKVSKVSISTQLVNTETPNDIQLPFHSHGEIMKSINHLAERQELLIDRCLASKDCFSESTQTDDCNDISSLFSSKKCPLPPMNFMSVLKCKHNLQQLKKIDLESQKLSINLDKIDCDKTVKSSNLNQSEQEYESYKYSLINKTIISDPNNLSLNQSTQNNVCIDQIHNVNNEKLFTSVNVLTNEDIKQVLKKNNYDFDDLLTKNSTNDEVLTSSSYCFPEIYNEFEAELVTLDQLNDSLGDIEKMGCDIPFKTNELFIDDKCNDLNLPTIVNIPCSGNNGRRPSFSKMNSVSSNVMSVDKTITGFSIQMFEQFIKDEEIRANQHQTIIRLKEKSLINRLNWEVTVCDVQLKHFKPQPRQLQLIKQKQRGSIKKLEQSLFQVKQLGRTVDSLYKQRLIMLNEHLQHLRKQSSSKKIIRKLKNLDRIPKKDECQSINTHLKQFEKTNFVDTVEGKHVNINSIELNVAPKNNKSPIVFELIKPKFNLRNQATSIDDKPKPAKKVNNVKVQTNIGLSLKSMNNKSIQTFRTLCFNNNIDENIKSSVPIDVSNKNEPFNSSIHKHDRSIISTTSPVKLNQCSPEAITSSSSEQSDMNVRITTLQEQLESRKLESLRLKKEQKKLRLENLKSKEQDLLKQIDIYDKKIEESKKCLMVELEKKNIQVTKCSIKRDSLPKNSSSIIQNVTNYGNSMKKHCDQLNVSDGISRTEMNNYVYPILMNKSSNKSYGNPKPLNKPIYEQQKMTHKSKENLDGYTYNCVPVKVKKSINKSCKSLETNLVNKAILLHKEPTAIEVDTFHGNQTKIDLLKPQSMEILIPSSIELEENLKKETHKNKIIEDIDINLDFAFCEYSILNQDKLNISTSQENNKNIENSILPYVIINSNSSDESLSISSNIQRIKFTDFNEDVSNECEIKENSVQHLKTLNNEIKLEDNYSPDFTSDENISYEFNEPYIIESQDEEQNNDSSYEENRSVGEIVMEDKTVIEHFSDDSDLVLNEKCSDDKIDDITKNILNNLLKDTFDKSKPLLSEKINLHNVTEKNSSTMVLNLENESDFLATTISDILIKRHMQPLVSETLQMYLPRLNKMEMENLILYLKWSSQRKKLKLSKCLSFLDQINYVENDESFDIFYEKYHEQKNSSSGQDENSDIILSHTKHEAEKLKFEQMRIEKEIERLRLSEEAQFFLREIPNKPPPPYKSPTKKKAISDLPYTFDEIHKIVFKAASKLFNNPQNSSSDNYIKRSYTSFHTNYKMLIFDYCKEITQETFMDEKYVPIWKNPVKTLKQFQARPSNPKDLSDMVLNKLNQILDIDECEKKVNKFVIKQMYEEKSKWTDFQNDEIDIQNNIVHNLMKKLICDTITNIKTNIFQKFN